MKVDYDELALASQLLRRQDDVHARAMFTYVKSECELAPWDLGLLLVALYPLTTASVLAGQQAFKLAGSLARYSAEALDATVADYVAADEAALAAVNQILVQLGASPIPWSDPTASSPTLGPAQSSADPGYGSAEGNIFEQAAEFGQDQANFLHSTVTRAGGRAGGWLGAGGGVTELGDPSSYLVPPLVGNSEMENLRWSAGPIIGGLDWVFEMVFHFSLLEDVVMKPIAGNWEAIDEASIAWGHLARASFEMGGNLTGLPDQVRVWDGLASEAFRAGMAALGVAYVGLSYVCDYVSGLMGIISTVAQAAASVIGFVLNKIAQHLLTLMVLGSIPVAGWIAAVAEVAIIIVDIVQALRLVYTVVDLIFDAIYDFVESKEQLVEVAFVIEDLLEFFTKAVVRNVV